MTEASPAKKKDKDKSTIDADTLPLVDIDDVLSNLYANQIYDYLRVSRNEHLQKFLESVRQKGASKESVRFSDRVVKINRKDKRQQRQLVITTKAIYNFKRDQFWKCKRRILLTDLKGLVLSYGSDEFVFQVKGEYDYRFMIKHRMEALQMIARYFEQMTAAKIPVVLSEEEDLRSHVVTKTMKKLSPQSPAGDLTHQTPRSLMRDGSTLGTDDGGDLHSPSSTGDVRPSLSSPSSESSTPLKSKVNGYKEESARVSGRMEGWLTKKKGASAKWDRKYFVLAGHQLIYYTPKIKGNVQLDKKAQVIREDNLDSLKGGNSKKALALLGAESSDLLTYRGQVVTSDRSKPLRFAAETEEALKRWLHAFQHPEEKTSKHLEGWLMKLDPSSDQEAWRRRYFVLLKGRIWYYEMIEKGTIDLRGGVSGHAEGRVQPTEPRSRKDFAGSRSRSRYAYRWNVSDSTRIFYLGADSQEEMHAWIKAVETANRKYTGSGAVADERSALGLPEEIMESIEQEAPKDLVTFVFTDVQGSTTLWEKVPDAMDLCLELHDKILRQLLKKFNGYEVKTEGDAFMVTFFTPLDAVLWCLSVQESLFKADWLPEFCQMAAAKSETVKNEEGKDVSVYNGIRIRMGIHCGRPNCRRNPITGRMDYFGPTVNQSARVSDSAHGGQVVCTQEVFDVLQDQKSQEDPRLKLLAPVHHIDHGLHSLKGIKDKVRIFQLLPASLALRKFPPLRTKEGEGGEKEKEKEKEKEPIKQRESKAHSVHGVLSSGEPAIERRGAVVTSVPRSLSYSASSSTSTSVSSIVPKRSASPMERETKGEGEDEEGVVDSAGGHLEEEHDEDSDSDEGDDVSGSGHFHDEEDEDDGSSGSLARPPSRGSDHKSKSSSAKRKLRLPKYSPSGPKPGKPPSSFAATPSLLPSTSTPSLSSSSSFNSTPSLNSSSSFNKLEGGGVAPLVLPPTNSEKSSSPSGTFPTVIISSPKSSGGSSSSSGSSSSGSSSTALPSPSRASTTQGIKSPTPPPGSSKSHGSK